MTARLYYDDCYLRNFRARIVETADDGRRVYLDQTAFYPTSGGQPADRGSMAGRAVVDVIDEEGRIAHVLSEPAEAGQVDCTVDWERRFDHMQQHSGQHLLSAVFVEESGVQTVSFHLGEAASTIDIAAASIEPSRLRTVERRVNQLVFENRPITISYEDVAQAAGLRKPSDREGMLRIVSIADLDRSACGGTHVRSTGEIGPVLIRKVDRVRGNARIEFLCGFRAIDRSRADYDALSDVARRFSGALDETPALVGALIERAQEADKERRRLATELAASEGRELYRATPPDAAGVRRHVRRIASGALDDSLRALAQGFTAGSGAVFVAAVIDPPTVLMAVSADAGVHAGNQLKQALAAAGGRGGGSATLAQGSVPGIGALELVLRALDPLSAGA